MEGTLTYQIQSLKDSALVELLLETSNRFTHILQHKQPMKLFTQKDQITYNTHYIMR